MTEETFFKELKKHLKYLTIEAMNEELKNYENLPSYNDLDPIEEANKIYKKRGINKTVSNKINFLDSISILIEQFRSKDKKRITNVLLFFVYLFFLLILIKIPFIYVRDMIANIFNNIFINDNIYNIFALIIELLYAITTIIVFIKLIKNKSLEFEKDE